MALVVKTNAKNFNAEKLQEELVAVPIVSLGWAGFVHLSSRVYTPFTEASRVIGRSSLTGDDVALRGELRFTTSRDLTGPEDTTLVATLAAHNAAVLTAEQTRQDQDEADLTAIFATERDAYVATITGWDAMTNAQKQAATKQNFITIGKIMRFILRRERGGAF